MALSRLPIKTIDRYILRGFIYSYAVSVAIMLSLYIMLDLFANIDDFTGGDKATTQIIMEIASYYFYHSFLYFAQIAGVITLVAASFTLARMQKTNELTAMLAGGISLYRVALPLIGAGLAFNALWVIDQELIIPRIADKLVLGHDEVSGKRSFSLWFLKDRNNALLSAMMYIPKQQRMEQLLTMERDEQGQIVAKLSADTAEWNEQKQCWDLTRGVRYSRSVGESEFAVAGEMTRKPVQYYYSDWKPEELVIRQSANWTMFLSVRQLNALLKEPHLVPNLAEVIASRHIRLTQPILNILLLFLGLPFFLNREPHNVLASVGLCLLAAISCFVVSFISQTMAGASPHPAFAAWLPIMVFGPLAAVLMENVKT
ncbi:MAG: LptF/LptG family permease [Phycisphaerae bacterium]